MLKSFPFNKLCKYLRYFRERLYVYVDSRYCYKFYDICNIDSGVCDNWTNEGKMVIILHNNRIESSYDMMLILHEYILSNFNVLYRKRRSRPKEQHSDEPFIKRSGSYQANAKNALIAFRYHLK